MSATKPPYKVTHQTANKKWNKDGTQAVEWTVGIEHNNGVKSEVTLPQAQYTAANVHAAAMEQVNTSAAVAALPPSSGA
jgi:hypothetical protein